MKWRLVMFVTAVALAIDAYLALNEGQVSRYGPAASLVVLLLWANYAGVALYLGAEAAKIWVLERDT